MRAIITAALCSLALATYAHEFNRLTISSVSEGSFAYTLIIPNTADGYRIQCVGYNSAGAPVLVQSSITDSLATKVLMVRDGVSASTFACVFDE